ncbi:hypothetical protein Tco_1490171, partial [Tanacetum coccineum]
VPVCGACVQQDCYRPLDMPLAMDTHVDSLNRLEADSVEHHDVKRCLFCRMFQFVVPVYNKIVTGLWTCLLPWIHMWIREV